MDTQQNGGSVAAAVNITTKSNQHPASTPETKIHWAGSGPANALELEQKFEAMRARNWITERMVQQYQKHWHCTREAALERLLSKVGT